MVKLDSCIEKLNEAVRKVKEYGTLIQQTPINQRKRNWNRELSYWKNKVSFYYEKLTSSGKGNIVKVIYIEEAPTYTQKLELVLVNLTKEEVKKLLKCREDLFNLKIKILEIQEYPTYIKVIPD